MSSVVPLPGLTSHERSLSEWASWERQRVSWAVFPIISHIDFPRRGARNRCHQEPPLHDELGAHLLQALLWGGADGDSSRRLQGGGLAVPRFHSRTTRTLPRWAAAGRPPVSFPAFPSSAAAWRKIKHSSSVRFYSGARGEGGGGEHSAGFRKSRRYGQMLYFNTLLSKWNTSLPSSPLCLPPTPISCLWVSSVVCADPLLSSITVSHIAHCQQCARAGITPALNRG